MSLCLSSCSCSRSWFCLFLRPCVAIRLPDEILGWQRYDAKIGTQLLVALRRLDWRGRRFVLVLQPDLQSGQPAWRYVERDPESGRFVYGSAERWEGVAPSEHYPLYPRPLVDRPAVVAAIVHACDGDAAAEALAALRHHASPLHANRSRAPVNESQWRFLAPSRTGACVSVVDCRRALPRIESAACSSCCSLVAVPL